MIKGWDEGFTKLSIGSKAIFSCPPDYAYGSKGKYDDEEELVPPDAFMTFKVELIDFKTD